MTNDLTTFLSSSKLPAINNDQLSQALSQGVADQGGISNSGVNFLSFSGKQGTFSYGRDKSDITDEMTFIVEPAATLAGWTCWKDSKAVGKHKWLMSDAFVRPEVVVAEGTLENHAPYRKNSGDGWKIMMGLGLLDTSSPTDPVEFTSTAVSAINGMKDIVQESSDRMSRAEPEIPIVTFGREQFTAQGSTNWKPTFNVEIWVDRLSVEAFMEGSLTLDDLLAGAAPKKKRKAPAKKKK